MQVNEHLPPSFAHYLFIDFENLQQVDLKVIGRKSVHSTLLLGLAQKKIDATLVEKLIQYAPSVELIRLTSAGKNALDFTLAYYVGRAVRNHPAGHFHIVSKDKGYDSLVEHLCSKNIKADRYDDFNQLTFDAGVKPLPSKLPSPPVDSKPKPKLKLEPSTLDQREQHALEHLRKAFAIRPGSQKKLMGFLISRFRNKLAGSDVAELIKHLQSAGHLAIDDQGKVTYFLDRK